MHPRLPKFLDGHPSVDKLYWPGLKQHRNHDVATRQMKDFGGMISFTVKKWKF